MRIRLRLFLGVATASQVNGHVALKKGAGAAAGLHRTDRIHPTLDSSSGATTAVCTGKAHVKGG
jgi:hypothetical protein